MISALRYANTNTYLIDGRDGSLLFDTGWAGTFPAFCRSLGENGKTLQDIRYILISHFHPDHCGIAQEIADHGAVLVAAEVQKEYLHAPDAVFAKEPKTRYTPIKDETVRVISIRESRKFLAEIGIDGEMIHTPGHSDDSISLCLDEGSVFVGDLNPLYELELHRGTPIEESWNRLLALQPHTVYYGHAGTAHLNEGPAHSDKNRDLYGLVQHIMRYIDKGRSLEWIADKTGEEMDFVENVARMYLTHVDVGVQGILDRIEHTAIAGKIIQ